MKSTPCTSTGSDREIFLTLLHTLFLICTCHGVLETGRIGRVTCNGNIHTLFMHNSHTFTNIVGSIASNLGTRTVRIGNLPDNFQLRCKIIELRLNVCKTIDSRNNHSCIFSKTVKDAAKRLFTNLISFRCNFDGTLSSCERFVSRKECEALRLLTEQSCSQITVT